MNFYIALSVFVVIALALTYSAVRMTSPEKFDTSSQNIIKTFQVRQIQDTGTAMSYSDDSVSLFSTMAMIDKKFADPFFKNVNAGDTLAISLTQPTDGRPCLAGSYFPVETTKTFFDGVAGNITADSPARIKGETIPVYTFVYNMYFNNDSTGSAIFVGNALFGQTASDIVNKKVTVSQVPGFFWLSSTSTALFLYKL